MRLPKSEQVSDDVRHHDSNHVSTVVLAVIADMTAVQGTVSRPRSRGWPGCARPGLSLPKAVRPAREQPGRAALVTERSLEHGLRS